ncbi:4'-phosphopantetheinyl transferase superfamily protein [Heliobacterium chlorum]|uniref:4'-phosphopantetheinyl transferase superfamily protein n=1 Tax=Heliobacterium chlorum TaxID=2698 RepID=A0ABR7SWZ7_HELCL|nr:4'-phosphopantetheinyl transferase superfamily protein [Heliobacterium chlorum]MBC9783074.1 4'-phosphopantetheinyl transferase superfamily protein [Heliobacterium chlorum]
MTEIYGIQINSDADSQRKDSLMRFVCKERSKKVNNYRFQQDSLRCLFGDLLSRFAICQRTGYRNNQLHFNVTTYNKPFLVDPSNVSFNVSHSGNWVVCAISDELVGIDIEHIRPIDLDIAKNFFSKEEYCQLLNQAVDHRLRYFYLLWTLKESYIKADGRGLVIPLDSFSMDIRNDRISVITDNALQSCFFTHFDIDKDHIVSVCSLDNNFSSTITEVTIHDILETLDGKAP